MAASEKTVWTTRELRRADLDAVVAIDAVHSGRGRRHFFERRFEAAERKPGDCLHVAVDGDRGLQGFAIARVLRGEFGHAEATAVLDALGVAPGRAEQGVGQSLMHGIVAAAKGQGVRALHSQVEWRNADLIGFFRASGFVLAPRLALERPVSDLAEELEDAP